MASVRLTRVVEFEAAHRIRRPDKSEAENRAAFGKAAADHAHRYQVRVTVRGPLVAEAGGVVNLAALDRVLKEEITDRKSTRLNSSHLVISYAVFCLKKKKKN